MPRDEERTKLGASWQNILYKTPQYIDIILSCSFIGRLCAYEVENHKLFYGHNVIQVSGTGSYALSLYHQDQYSHVGPVPSVGLGVL